MRIVVTGGGSGGHITPILAVARELKQLDPATEIIYIGQRGDALADVPEQHPAIDEVRTVRAGKFRRYHGEGLKQLLDVPTVYKNLRDMVWVVVGLWQSFWLLRSLKPQVIFVKGGFVGVPVGLAAALLRIPYVTHDSDVIPGLANRVIARWATAHAVALPEELYHYPIDKTVTVGVPVSSEYVPVTSALQEEYRRHLGLQAYKQVVLVTGGGNGARRLNELVIENASFLLKRFPGLAIVHLSGRSLENETKAAYAKALTPEQVSRVSVKGFVHDLHMYSGAADVIIARGSATNLAEFAIQSKPCLVIPASQLIWTVKNSETLAKAGAVMSLNEDQASQELRLANTLASLLENPGKMRELGKKLQSYARPGAAKHLAKLLIEKARSE